MKLKFWLALVFVVAIIIRLFFNFSHELIPGVNGGYYPLQVRSIIENGHLAFADMPLLFYFDAGIIKLISYLGAEITDKLIIFVVKFIDSICLPFVLFPLFKILRQIKISVSKSMAISILMFAVLSFSPLILISDLQKNALAIVFLVFGFHQYFLFQENKTKKHAILIVIFLVSTALTHFGTFVLFLFFVLLNSILLFRKKAIIPLFITLLISSLLIYFFDATRFFRLISFWNVIFEKPALLSKAIMPPDFIILLFNYLLIPEFKSLMQLFDY